MREIDIHRIYMDGYAPDVFYTKGHVDIAEFKDAARVYCDDVPVGAHYAWIRYNPDSSGQFDFMVVDGTPGKQGTFPATVSYCPERKFRLFKEWPRMPKEG